VTKGRADSSPRDMGVPMGVVQRKSYYNSPKTYAYIYFTCFSMPPFVFQVPPAGSAWSNGAKTFKPSFQVSGGGDGGRGLATVLYLISVIKAAVDLYLFSWKYTYERRIVLVVLVYRPDIIYVRVT